MNTNCRFKRTKKITKYVFNERMRRAENEIVAEKNKSRI